MRLKTRHLQSRSRSRKRWNNGISWKLCHWRRNWSSCSRSIGISQFRFICLHLFYGSADRIWSPKGISLLKPLRPRLNWSVAPRLSGFDVKPILDWIRPYAEKLPLPEFVVKILSSDTNAGSAGYVAIALIIYKLCTPARYATTVGVSYYVIQYSVRRGLIKPAPSGQQIKARVIKSQSQLNKALRERLNKREEMRKKLKNKKHK